MPTSNVIDAREQFLARRSDKSNFMPDYQVMYRDFITVKPFPAAKFTKKRVQGFLQLFYERGIAYFTLIDEDAVVIAGEKRYRAMRSVCIPVYVFTGLGTSSITDKSW